MDFGFLVIILDDEIEVITIGECYIREGIQMILKRVVNELNMVEN